MKEQGIFYEVRVSVYTEFARFLPGAASDGLSGRGCIVSMPRRMPVLPTPFGQAVTRFQVDNARQADGYRQPWVAPRRERQIGDRQILKWLRKFVFANIA
jgi:hypothetical protein